MGRETWNYDLPTRTDQQKGEHNGLTSNNKDNKDISTV